MAHPASSPTAPIAAPPSGGERRARRLPAVRMKLAREDRRGWSVLSVLLHAGIIALLAIPGMMLHTRSDLLERAQGAGGPGPAGGGGGGNRGTGGETPELIRYVTVTPPPPTPVAVVPPVTPPPTPKPEPPKVEPPKAEPVAAIPAAPSVIAGVGGGSGTDGSAGMGPGSGGGVGTGIGTGRGSGVGAGTGGGAEKNYDPTPEVLPLPPMPVPSGARGAHVVAQFDVDSTGKVLWWAFSPTRDRGYNKQLEEVLKTIRWRPGTTPAGRAIRDTAQITWDLP